MHTNYSWSTDDERCWVETYLFSKTDTGSTLYDDDIESCDTRLNKGAYKAGKNWDDPNLVQKRIVCYWKTYRNFYGVGQVDQRVALPLCVTAWCP